MRFSAKLYQYRGGKESRKLRAQLPTELSVEMIKAQD